MTLRPLLASLLVVSATSCAHSVTVDNGAIALVELQSTVKGEVPSNVISDVDVAAAGAPLASVTWKNHWSQGGAVHWFADRLICVRQQGRPRFRTSALGWDASTDIGTDMIRLDISSAEERALESGIAVDDEATRFFLIVTTTAITPTDTTAAQAQALTAARALVSAGAKQPVQVVLVNGDSDHMVLRLDTSPARISDELPLALTAPMSTTSQQWRAALLTLPLAHEGSPYTSDVLELVVTEGNRTQGFVLPDASDADGADGRSAALRLFAAVDNGCRFE